jgi:hypothetical protein
MRSSTKPSLQAGAGRARIVLAPEVFPVDGFVAERDPLYARVVIVQRENVRIALAVLDQTSLSAGSLAGITRVLTEATGVAAGQLLVCASHTFSAPHPVDETVQKALEDARLATAGGRPGSGGRPELPRSTSTGTYRRRTAGGWAPTTTATPTRNWASSGSTTSTAGRSRC